MTGLCVCTVLVLGRSLLSLHFASWALTLVAKYIGEPGEPYMSCFTGQCYLMVYWYRVIGLDGQLLYIFLEFRRCRRLQHALAEAFTAYDNAIVVARDVCTP